MVFKHLKIETCPTCGAQPYQEGIEVDWNESALQTHANGQQWEWRTFLCGCQVRWVPNFERAEVVRGLECRHAPEVKQRQIKRDEAEKRLQAFVDTLDVDEVFKRDINFPGRRQRS